jgi:hypothetical protein
MATNPNSGGSVYDSTVRAVLDHIGFGNSDLTGTGAIDLFSSSI